MVLYHISTYSIYHIPCIHTVVDTVLGATAHSTKGHGPAVLVDTVGCSPLTSTYSVESLGTRIQVLDTHSTISTSYYSTYYYSVHVYLPVLLLCMCMGLAPYTYCSTDGVLVLLHV